MIRLATTAAASLLLLAACNSPESTKAPEAEAPAASATPAVDANALTADGFGVLRIGMTKAEVDAALGPDSDPEAVGGAEPEVCDQWRPERAPDGLLVMVQDGVLTRISVSAPSTLKTDRGFGVGDTAQAIKAAYGGAAVSQPHKYSPAPAEDIFVWASGGPATPDAWVENAAARGVRYEIDSQGRVGAIHVGGPAIQFVEGCA
ncbi:hypothetical protein [Brevundimonas sp.]|uniref:hypothetical protein n=1 Tax=Brevundimonas sp. TaxID=1871086 RepID=UPI002D2DA8E9|nr:hypothetical protein [Brevundimonas sp.]HYD29086.1 hypothetical protein [Brevundimonas sp.]